MTTREIIAYMQKKASQFTPAELLVLLDQVQKIVMAKVTAQRTCIDEATGMPPFLATTAGTYTYDCPANCQRTLNVFASDITSYSRIEFGGTFREYQYRGASYYGLPIKATEAVYGVLAKLTFVGFNPGTSTTKYYHEYLYKPPDITAQTVELVIPEQCHFGIVDGVLARVRGERYGENSEWEQWKRNTLPEIVSQLNQGTTYFGYTPIRPEYRHYSNTIYGAIS